MNRLYHTILPASTAGATQGASKKRGEVRNVPGTGEALVRLRTIHPPVPGTLPPKLGRTRQRKFRATQWRRGGAERPGRSHRCHPVGFAQPCASSVIFPQRICHQSPRTHHVLQITFYAPPLPKKLIRPCQTTAARRARRHTTVTGSDAQPTLCFTYP